ncbi:MAG: molybdopterin converting factor subunit 1 [Cellvibrionaceae bacterium]|nr:molybdopterin converting factor subunit 1 [Cellvibrionaceae bacterium]
MIKILYFARYREQLNCDGESFELPRDNYTLAELLAELRARPEPWPSTLGDNNLLAAVNQELSQPGHILCSGDEVALFPPVTGG